MVKKSTANVPPSLDDLPTPREVVTTKQARSALSTRRLLDAAAELIAEKGLNNTTLAMIGEHAGYSHGLVTRRFGSKNGLLMALVERMTTGWFETYVNPEIDKANGLGALRLRVGAIRAGWEISERRMRALYTLMFEGAMQPIPELRTHMQQLHRFALKKTTEAVERGISDGSLRSDLDPSATARFITCAVRGIAYHAMIAPERGDIFEAMDDLARYVDSLAAKP